MEDKYWPKIGDKVNRANPSYSFPGTVIAVYQNTEGYWYAVVEMDNYKLQHIFRIEQIKLI
jgi:hypothetical protein